MCVCLYASHRVIFAGLELEVMCFVKHWVLLHEQLLIELLYYLRETQIDIINPGKSVDIDIEGANYVLKPHVESTVQK